MIEPRAWWKDNTGRFALRPFYGSESLEAIASEFRDEQMRKDAALPISDLALLEVADFSTASFDRARDMSSLENPPDAVTIFSSEGLPTLYINADLSAPNMRYRLRMTIAHELGHIVLHQPLYQSRKSQLDFLQEFKTVPAYCVNAMSKPEVDWCEWQASYFGGALLAPKRDIFKTLDVGEEPKAERVDSAVTLARIAATSKKFEISKDAARVRLAQVGLIKQRGSSEESFWKTA